MARSEERVSRAQSVPSASSRARISGTSPAEKHRFTASSMAGNAAPRTGCASSASTAMPSAAIRSARVPMRPRGTKCVANPTHAASAPSARAPVSPMYMPKQPRSRGSRKDAPMSGNRPMAVSGMANTAASEATR